MNVLDIFSGIGGFSLGLERAGMRTVAFCEIDPFCRRVLGKHWPNVPVYDDVRTLTVDRLRADGIVPDVICGGFPCQDISEAGARAGLEGERSGLWTEFARVIREVRPRFAIVENVSDLLCRGLDRVLGDLAEIGFDAEWHCISAASIGARHIRDRVWILAYPAGERREPLWGQQFAESCNQTGTLDQWSSEPALDRVADGVSGRMVQIAGLGNAVVPQIPEIIGRAIMTAALPVART